MTAAGLFSAARAWWMFRVFGHDDVAVLDGGLPKWKAEGRPLDEGPALKPQERHFTARYQSMMVRDMADVAAPSSTGSAQIADARSPGASAARKPSPAPVSAPATCPAPAMSIMPACCSPMER